ncbi:MAG TPA: hypothetical protein VE913_14030 [Longimicrobium sp.]|nr:hypothetical protein [Longimicrobium sp.]
MPISRIALALAFAALAGCGADAAREQASPPPAAPAGVVDSIHSPEESLRRFRVGVPEPASLSGGAASRDALVRRFIRAVERRDTADLRSIVVTRAEFAYLIYPDSRFSRPPTRMEPALQWFQMQMNSEKGISRVLRRHGGADTGFASYACEAEPLVEGATRVWEECSIRRADAERGEHSIRWFGSVVERGGHFKILSYANAL